MQIIGKKRFLMCSIHIHMICTAVTVEQVTYFRQH